MSIKVKPSGQYFLRLSRDGQLFLRLTNLGVNFKRMHQFYNVYIGLDKQNFSA